MGVSFYSILIFTGDLVGLRENFVIGITERDRVASFFNGFSGQYKLVFSGFLFLNKGFKDFLPL
jgi:hypothetical protein